ncbi:protein N-lysine methyltransferase METTL21A-like [Carica papaya]|uniref:protein N-lysine methyltransferase METTL21A-like n=1 Tax=Carica papaya TaxID=3649 RepID=UPI000B8C97D7|nr:protein N-lysine methyltransferase METTL21A-like [Carica papaya]
MASQEGDEDDVDPLKILLPEDQNGGNSLSTVHSGEGNLQLQRHYLRSIQSTVVIRQLPSRGLSFQLWPAATTLFTLLDNDHCDPSNSPLASTLTAISTGSSTRPLKILELGSGTGLVGIAAAATLGADVMVTDLAHVIPNLQFNAEANADVLASRGGRVKTAPLKWGDPGDVERMEKEFDFDLVLASDVVYHDHLYDPLIETLRLLLLNGGGDENKKKERVFVMAHLRRWKKDSSFFKKAKKLFVVDVIHADRPSEGSRIGVVVYRFSGKKKNLNSELPNNP